MPVTIAAGGRATTLRTLAVVATMLVALLVTVPIANAVGNGAARGPVDVFPTPGERYASAATTISFRGIPASEVGVVGVEGSSTGVHTGTWIAHSDGLGATFTPAARFAPGERITVRTHLNVVGAPGGSFSFTIAHPSSVTRVPADDNDVGAVAPVGRAARISAAPAAQRYRSRPDLQAPVMTRDVIGNSVAAGLIAVTPRGISPAVVQQTGPVLYDNAGHVVWDNPVPDGVAAFDEKVAKFHGQDVLMWFQGQLFAGYGAGTYQMVDTHYRTVAVAKAGNGYSADIHDMAITPQNTAILISYVPVAMDLTAFGGAANGTVLELVIQEVDPLTGAVLLEWHSLDHVPLAKSLVAPPAGAGTAWDYMHGNAVSVDTDGNILVSARYTSSVYKINRHSGALMWTLGRGGDFTANGFGDTDWFSFQHDVRRRSDGTLSVFDNGNGPVANRNYSRGLVLSVDEVQHTVSIVRQLAYDGIDATSQGDFRELPLGHDFIGWGSIGQFTEFDAAGNAQLDMKFPAGVQSYRAVKVDWHATPATPPAMVIDHPTPTSTRVAVSWNGATDVARWVMEAGPDLQDLGSVASATRTDFETTVSANVVQPAIKMVALDAHGNAIGSAWTGPASPPSDATGYVVARANGRVRGFGSSGTFWSATVRNGDHVAGLAAASAGGYWIATAHGDVIAFGTASHGSLIGHPLRAPIVGIAGTPDGKGYWLVGADGGIFAFGSARFHGSAARTRLRAPIVGINSTPDGNGYWLAGRDGGIFAFGSARFHGSAAFTRLRAPIVGIARTHDGNGYWLVGSDGGIFAFGSARFLGSAGNMRLRAPIVGMSAMHDSSGYWLVARDGGIFTFGIARYQGGVNTEAIDSPVVAIMHS